MCWQYCVGQRGNAVVIDDTYVDWAVSGYTVEAQIDIGGFLATVRSSNYWGFYCFGRIYI